MNRVFTDHVRRRASAAGGCVAEKRGAPRAGCGLRVFHAPCIRRRATCGVAGSGPGAAAGAGAFSRAARMARAAGVGGGGESLLWDRWDRWDRCDRCDSCAGAACCGERLSPTNPRALGGLFFPFPSFFPCLIFRRPGASRRQPCRRRCPPCRHPQRGSSRHGPPGVCCCCFGWPSRTGCCGARAAAVKRPQARSRRRSSRHCAKAVCASRSGCCWMTGAQSRSCGASFVRGCCCRRRRSSWDAAQLRSVLMHELAHIRRRDTAVQCLTQIACALHWFNPLVWLAAWRLHVERERACDDLVLASGVRPSEYAGHLLHVATKLSPARWTAACGLAMARKSSLEGRLLAVLSERLNRGGLTRALTAAAILLSVAIAIPVAMLRGAGRKTGGSTGK